MGTARFYEFLAVEHPDLSVFIVQPGIIKTALYEKGELQLDNTIDTSKCCFICAYISTCKHSPLQQN